MKNLILFLVLSSTTAFAETDFDKFTISEIYERGYMLEATVEQELGILVNRDQLYIELSPVEDDCLLKLRKKMPQDSLLKKGTKISFQAIGSGLTDNGRDGLYSISNLAFVGLDYQRYAGHSQTSLLTVKSSCKKMSFSVIENDSLTVINMNPIESEK